VATTIYVTAPDLLDLALRTRGMTQERLAHHIGMSQKHVSQVLTGQKRMSPRFAAACQRALDNPELADWLLVAQAHTDAADAVAALD
jgi:plasmid maintenance system antidote protein VapI